MLLDLGGVIIDDCRVRHISRVLNSVCGIVCPGKAERPYLRIFHDQSPVNIGLFGLYYPFPTVSY